MLSPALARLAPHPGWHAYVDGSNFQEFLGAGFVILKDDVVQKTAGLIVPIEFNAHASRNVGGELVASMLALTWLENHKVDHPVFHFDLRGVQHWATGFWTARTPFTKAYRDYVEDRSFSRIVWAWHKGHTGVYYNEVAHKLAYGAVFNAYVSKYGHPPKKTNKKPKPPVS